MFCRNFFHLVLLLFELGNSKLRLYFKNTEWPTVLLTNGLPSNNWGNHVSDGKLCLQLIKKGHIHIRSDQKQLIESGDIEQWDATLLIMILKHFDTLGFVSRSSTEDSALEHIRNTRNKRIAHNPNSKLAKAEFTKIWQDSCSALKVFGATDDEIADVEKSELNIFFIYHIKPIQYGLMFITFRFCRIS